MTRKDPGFEATFSVVSLIAVAVALVWFAIGARPAKDGRPSDVPPNDPAGVGDAGASFLLGSYYDFLL